MPKGSTASIDLGAGFRVRVSTRPPPATLSDSEGALTKDDGASFHFSPSLALLASRIIDLGGELV